MRNIRKWAFVLFAGFMLTQTTQAEAATFDDSDAQKTKVESTELESVESGNAETEPGDVDVIEVDNPESEDHSTETEYGAAAVSETLTEQTKTEDIESQDQETFIYGSAGKKTVSTPVLQNVVNSSNGITVQWKQMSGIDGMIIYRSTSENGTYSYCGMVNGTKTSMFKDHNVSKKQMYYYKIFAFQNTSSGKVYSHPSGVKSGAICPSGVSNVKTDILGNGKINVNWAKVSDADGYMIYMARKADGDYKFEALIPGNEKHQYTDSNLTVGGTYYYEVFAYYNISGTRIYSESSQNVSGQAIGKSPTGIYKVLGNGFKSLKLYWRKTNDAAGYLVYRSKDNTNFAYAGETSGADSNTYTDSTLTCGTTYYYKIFPYYNIDGKRVYCKGSDAVSGKPIPAKAKITGIQQVYHEELEISWGQVSGATGYLVYKSTDPNGTFTYCGSVNNGAVLSYTDAKVSRDNTYYYKIFAYRTVNGTNVYANGSDVSGQKVVADNSIHYGIDVSHHQGDIDWNQVKASGMEYVIIKAAGRYYGGGGLYTDDRFASNIAGAQAAGLKVGVYFFSQALNTDEAREEAQYLLNTISGYNLTYPVVFDWETAQDYRTWNLSVTQDQMNDIAYAFCDTVSSAGYKAMVYGNQSDLTNRYNLGALSSRYDIWLARYCYFDGNRYQEGQELPDLGVKYMIWQFTSEGNVSGINGNVDMNISYYQ